MEDIKYSCLMNWNFMKVKLKFQFISKICFLNAGVEDEDHFFSTQERQSIVLHLLYAIRILENETINGIKFKIDQSLSNCSEFFSYEMNELFI